MYEIETASGTIQVLYTMTLGDIASIVVTLLLLATFLLYWVYQVLWGRR